VRETNDTAWDFSAPGGPRLVSEPDGPAASAQHAPFSPARLDAGGDTSISDSIEPVGAPTGWLIGAGACLATAIGLGLIPGQHPVLWTVGWFMGGFACIGLVAAFTLADSRRRASAWYTSRPIVSHARTVLIVFAAIAVTLNAWRFADWASRR
jgi:hypothetical protein